MAEPMLVKGSFTSDLRKLLESGEGADVVLVVGDSQLPAHSQFLAARSAVFAAMFRNKMQEASSRRIEITDMQEAAVREMLCFIYTDTCPQLESVAADLLAAGDKYDLPLLKERCEQQMVKGLSVENAAATAGLAVLHRCPGLRSAAVEFIARYPKVLATGGWAHLLRDSAEAAVEICEQVAAVKIQPAPQLALAKTETNKSDSHTSSASRIVPEELKQKMVPMLLDAARCGRAREVWALLTAGAPKDARDSSGDTALHLAAANGQASTVKYLLDQGLDANAVNNSKETPLHKAACKNDTDIIWMLVGASARVDAQDSCGRTPLYVAAQRDNCVQDGLVHLIKALLLAGARKDVRTRSGKTPEDVATQSTRSAFNSTLSPYSDL